MFARIKAYFIGVYAELKRTTWPNRKTLVSYTIIVVVSCVIAVAVLDVIDLGLTSGIQYIVTNAK